MLQVIAFASAVCNAGMGDNLLIVCQDTNQLLHWKYHCSTLFPEMEAIIADNNQSIEVTDTTPIIILTSMNNMLFHHPDELRNRKYKFVVVHDQFIEIDCRMLEKLQTIIGQKTPKVIVSNGDVLVSDFK